MKESIPCLLKLLKKFLVPVSSAPVERPFSIAGKVFTPDRCNLTDSRFKHVINNVLTNVLKFFQMYLSMYLSNFCQNTNSICTCT